MDCSSASTSPTSMRRARFVLEKCSIEAPTAPSILDDTSTAERLCNLGFACAVAGRSVEGVSHFMNALFSLSCDLQPPSRILREHSALERPSKRRKTCYHALAEKVMTFPELLGEAYQSSEYDEGMSVFSACLPIANAKNDRVHMKAIILLNLATLNVALENFDVALTCFKRSLENALEENRDINHDVQSLLVQSLHGMGNLYFKCGRIEISIDCFEAALNICEKSDDVEPVEMAAILNCLGVLQFHKGQCEIDKTASLFRRALAIQKTLQGPNHFTIATTLNNLGRVLCIGGQFDEALQVYEEAFNGRVSTLGYDHLDVAATAYNIGQTLQQQKEFERALEYYNHFMFIATNKLGHLHMDVALTLKCIAQIHQEYRRFDKALSIYRMALNAAYTSVGRHAEVASILNKMGNIYFEKGDLDKARDAYELGLQVERANLDSNHPNIAVTLSNLGLILHRKGDMVGAVKMYKKSLKVQKCCYGQNDARVAATWSNVGHIQLNMQDYAMALDSFQHALRILRNNATGDDVDVATTLNSVGLVLFKMGINKLALRTFSECLRIRRSLLGSNDRDVAVPMYNMGTTYHVMGFDDEAVQCFYEVLRIERLCGDEDVASTLNTLAQVHETLGDREIALSCYEEILQGLNKSSASDEPVVVRTLMAIANIHLRRGDTKNLLERALEAVRVRQHHNKGYGDLRLSGFFLFDLSKICPEASPAA